MSNKNKDHQEILSYIEKKSAALASTYMQKILGAAYKPSTIREADMADEIAHAMKLAYPAYKPGKASVKTYLYRKGELKAKQLCEAAFCKKRKGALYEHSLDAELLEAAMPVSSSNFLLVVDLRARLHAIRLNKDLMSLALVLVPEISVEGVKLHPTEARCIVDGWSRASYYRRFKKLAKVLLGPLPQKSKAEEQHDKKCKNPKKK